MNSADMNMLHPSFSAYVYPFLWVVCSWNARIMGYPYTQLQYIPPSGMRIPFLHNLPRMYIMQALCPGGGGHKRDGGIWGIFFFFG